jgi:K+-sensing histidine kinase KdpD
MALRAAGLTKSAIAVTLTTVLVVGIVAAAAIFSIARGARGVGQDGTVGILAEATLSAAAATHNAVAQALVINEAEVLGVAAPTDRTTSLERAEEALAELESRTDHVIAELEDEAVGQRINEQSSDLIASASRVIAAIRDGELEGSVAEIDSEIQSSYEALATTLVELRNETYSSIAIARDDAGRLADAARFLVVLLIPVTILLAYRSRINRAQARQDLENKLEKEHAVSRTKSDFISHMSHQLRTPLTSIYGSALALSDPSIDSSPALTRELISLMTEESTELARMVEDMLAVAAEDQGRLTVDSRPIDPAAETKGALEPLTIAGYKTVRYLEPSSIIADPRHFRQAISNLVSNAHRYGLGPVVVEGYTDGSEYTIDVIDHGPGVDPETEQRLFDRFCHEGDSPLVTGTVGLGLAVAEILVTRMDGAIAYQRRDNTTVFTIRLPLA